MTFDTVNLGAVMQGEARDVINAQIKEEVKAETKKALDDAINKI